MAMNEIGFNQVSQFLNDMLEEATGQKSIAPTDEKEFVSVATTVLKQGYEPFINSLSAIMNRTIFAVRPYNRKFAGINVSEERYGAITRKVSYIDAKNNADEVIHVLSEYNAKTGLNLDAKTVYQPENYASFVKWLNARIATVSEMMTERSVKFHTNITDKEVMRHTPLEKQKVYLYKPFQEEIKSMALSGLYHDSYINLTDFEGVNYWQSIDSPMAIKSNPTYLKEDGTLENAKETVETEKLLGVIFDRDALGYTVVKHTIASTPLNAKGLYYNTWYHFTDKYWNDFTENGVVLLLD